MVKYYQQFLDLGCFQLSDATKIVGNENTAKSLLKYYCQKGYVSQVKKNLYVVMDIVAKAPLLNKYNIASALADDAFVSCRSAFEYYGYTNQVIYDIWVTSAKRFRDFEFDGYRYHRLTPTITGGIKTIRGVKVTDEERTFIDNINTLDQLIGLEELLNCLSSGTALKEEKLICYLQAYGKQFLYQKVGLLMKRFQQQLNLSDGFFKLCKDKAGKSSRYLTKNISKNHLAYSSEWRLTYPDYIWTYLNGGTEDANI